MKKVLPPRPNLDHLRRQAKSLLAALASGDAKAVSTFQQHLPSASKLSDAQVRAAQFRLADAQSAIARSTGFASWPQLARHVEQLRSLEGTWSFASLEVDGSVIPAEGLTSSRLLIDGDRFRTESPEAIYEGVFNIDVEADPHHIDIEFIAGPESGNWNYGIFRLNADQLELCLDVTGKGRPTELRTSPGTGHAYEVLHRDSKCRPDAVHGGTRLSPPTNEAAQASPPNAEAFKYTPSPTHARLQGDWDAKEVVRDGQPLPAMMLKTGRRTSKDNEVTISFGGQVIIQALTRINESTEPIEIDYLNLAGPAKGSVQEGIMQCQGKDAQFCMAAPGQPRPGDFTCPPGSGRTLSRWSQRK